MNRKTDILSCLPDFLKEYPQMQKLSEIENAEIDTAKSRAWKILRNAFINTCDEDGIGYFEKLYGITSAKDSNLSERKSNCLRNKRMNFQPMTELFLKEYLKQENVQILVDYENYTMYVSNLTSSIEAYLRNTIPANIKISLLPDVVITVNENGNMTINRIYIVDENGNITFSQVFTYVNDYNLIFYYYSR